jgi:aerobic carbon-monoxide dehydrogenase large subunit
MKRPNALIGSPVKRVEDLRFVRGRGEYVGDLARDGLLHAAIFRSPVAHGVIRRLDVTAARAYPGVHAVITAGDLGAVPTIPMRMEPLPDLARFAQPVLAHGKVRYVGEPAAVVIADSVERAEDALERITFVAEPLAPVLDRMAAAAGNVFLFEEHRTNVATTMTGVAGDAAQAFASAPYVRAERFSVQRHTAMTMEPRGLMAQWDAQGRLTVFGACKVPFAIRALLAKLFGLPETAIDVIENDAGGGFGVRGEFYPEDFLMPYAARVTGRPVRWIEGRREHFLATTHAREAECELEIACRNDGKIVGLRGRAWSDMGAYIRPNAVTAPRNLAQVMAGPYSVPNVHMDVSLVMTNKTPSGSYRGPGRFEADFFRERLIDMAARDLASIASRFAAAT